MAKLASVMIPEWLVRLGRDKVTHVQLVFLERKTLSKNNCNDKDLEEPIT